MNMYTSSELATKTKMVCDAARKQGCAIISTNGKADLAIINLGDFETINEFVHMYDSWLAAGAVARMRRGSAGRELAIDEVDAEIRAAREEARARREG